MTASKEHITGERATLATISRKILIIAPSMKRMVDDVVQKCVKIQKHLQKKNVRSHQIMELVIIPNGFTTRERNAQQVKRTFQMCLSIVYLYNFLPAKYKQLLQFYR